MPHVKIYCDFTIKNDDQPCATVTEPTTGSKKSVPLKVKDEGKNKTKDEESCNNKHTFTFTREIYIPTSDMTEFYYAVRGYFRKSLTDEERETIIAFLSNLKDSSLSNIIKTMKRKKIVTLVDAFPNNYYVEGVEKIGTNKYNLLWGL